MSYVDEVLRTGPGPGHREALQYSLQSLYFFVFFFFLFFVFHYNIQHAVAAQNTYTQAAEAIE